MVEVVEDTPTSGYVKVTDPDDSEFTFTLTQDPIHGSVILNGSTGEFTYTPALNSNEPDSFKITVADDTNNVVTTVSITITPTNDQPVASELSFDATEDVVLSASLIAGGSDIDGDALTFSKASDPAVGTVTVNPNGSFIYSPLAEFSGTVTFAYIVSDGSLTSDPAMVTINVAAARDFEFLGLQDPWQVSPLYTVKVGSAVPLKWQYAPIAFPNTPIPTEFFYPQVNIEGPFACNLDGDGPIAENPNYPGASNYQYSASTYTHQFNWDTDGGTIGMCYNIHVFNPVDGWFDGPFKIKLKK